MRWERRETWSLWASSSWPLLSSKAKPANIFERCCQGYRTFLAGSPLLGCSTCLWSRPRHGNVAITDPGSINLTQQKLYWYSIHRIWCNWSNVIIIFCVRNVFRYVERVSEVLRQKMKQAEILVLKGATMVEKRQEALEEQSRLEPRVDLLAGRTRELQKLVLDYYFNLFMLTGLAAVQLTGKRRLCRIRHPSLSTVNIRGW